MKISSPLNTTSLFLLLVLCNSVPLVGQTPATVELGNERGPCVLLRNQNVLFGQATQRGNDVSIVRGDNSEIHVPRSEVLCWADSLRDLYLFRVDQRSDFRVDQRSDINTGVHLEDARWCLRYGLFDLTARELLQVYRKDKNNQAAQRIEQELRRRIAAQSQESKSPVALATSNVTPDDAEPESTAVVAASHTEPQSEPNEFSPTMIHSFARDVQPILANRCGRCHNTTTESSWTLHLPSRGSRPSARMTRANLAVTARYVNFQSPLKSELRLRALDGHAGASSMHTTRDSAAMRSIESWLEAAQPPGTALARAKQVYASEKPQLRSETPRSIASDGIDEGTQSDDSELDASQVDDSQPAGRLPEVANPFDPEIFNRRFHR